MMQEGVLGCMGGADQTGLCELVVGSLSLGLQQTQGSFAIIAVKCVRDL